MSFAVEKKGATKKYQRNERFFKMREWMNRNFADEVRSYSAQTWPLSSLPHTLSCWSPKPPVAGSPISDKAKGSFAFLGDFLKNTTNYMCVWCSPWIKQHIRHTLQTIMLIVMRGWHYSHPSLLRRKWGLRKHYWRAHNQQMLWKEHDPRSLWLLFLNS